LGALFCAWITPTESRAVAQQLLGFPDSDVAAQSARPYILGILCFIPALSAVLYTLGDTIDRYITRRFLSMFGICLSALFVIWMLMDMADNMSDFRSSKYVWHTIFVYYTTRLPGILLLLLPYSLLLSLLESIGKLSTNREIIAIIQSGRGVLRLTTPLIIAGAICTLFSIGLNYHWAPTAEGRQNDILDEATGKTATEASKVLYRNLETQRLWMVREFPPDYEKGRPLIDVEVTTTSENDRLITRLSASHASWDSKTRAWTFENALLCHYSPGQPPLFDHPDKPLVIDTWSETPWQIIKPGLSAEFLGIPDLNAWLHTNSLHPQFANAAPYQTHWHYRWALPFTCLITVLLATPFAIHFTRRGAGGGIFLAVILSALMLLVNTIVLSFGEAGILPPMLAAWLPNAIFASIGIYLYRRRITGRPIYHSIRRLFLPA
jgi:lipopolysaccharide export system permease protein